MFIFIEKIFCSAPQNYIGKNTNLNSESHSLESGITLKNYISEKKVTQEAMTKKNRI
jgi:hypothetical protein